MTRLLLALSLFASLAACSTLSNIKVSGGPPVKIGVVGPMTGQLTDLGGQMRYGVGVAMDDIGKRGGTLDSVFTLRAVDDKCDAKRAEMIARGLVSEKIQFVVGHFCSAASIAAAPVYSEANVIAITPASSDPALTDRAAARGAENIFRLVPREDMQGPTLAAYILAHYRDRAIAIVQEDSELGRYIAAPTTAALAASGVQPSISETITPGDTDFSALVGRLKAANIGVIVFGGYAQEAALLAVEARRQGFAAVLAGGEALSAEAFKKLAGAASEGTIVTTRSDLQDLPSARRVIDSLGSRGIDAGDYALRSYAAVQLIDQAATRAKSLDPTAIAKALHEGRFDTAIGPVSFDRKGDLKDQRFTVKIWHNGSLQPA